MVLLGATALGAHSFACSNGEAGGSVLADASFDAFDLGRERDAGPPCLFDESPHKLGPPYAPIFSAFAVGKTLKWFGVEDPIGEDTGSIGSWSAKIEGGAELFDTGIGKGQVALWVDRNAVYSSRGYNVEIKPSNASGRSFDAPGRYEIRAMVADDKELFALVASSDCRMSCDAPRGHQLVARSLAGTDANWRILDSSVDRLPPSPWKGDLAQDEKTLFFVLRNADGSVEIRAIEKNGAGARSVLTTKIPDSGATACLPPDVCIDGDLRQHRGNLYWLGVNIVFATPSTGGSPSVIVDVAPARVTWFALDGDFIYTNELAASGKVDLVRRPLSKLDAPKVIFSHQLVEPPNRYKVGAIAIGPNEIYTLVETAGPPVRRELIGLCKE